jgi:hypothetical protein
MAAISWSLFSYIERGAFFYQRLSIFPEALFAVRLVTAAGSPCVF